MKYKIVVAFIITFVMCSSGLTLAAWGLRSTDCFPPISQYEETVMWANLYEDAHQNFPWKHKLFLNTADLEMAYFLTLDLRM